MNLLRQPRRKRNKVWSSTRKWHEARRKKERLENKLGKVKQSLEPDVWVRLETGILVGVHRIRRGYRDQTEFRFEFFRKESNKRYGLCSDFGEHDLMALSNAALKAKAFCADQRRQG